MKVLVADYSGFCFGVKKAVSAAYDTENYAGSIYTYGPIIHNRTVVDGLEAKGVRQLKSVDDLKEGDTIIIRSHGVSKDVIDSLNGKKLNIVDATCPYVDNIHKKVDEYYKRGYQIIIIGDPNHPEVVGVNGWCENSALILNDIADSEKMKRFAKVCIVAQTTFNTSKWRDIVSSLLDISKEIVVCNTICNATLQRQKSATELAKRCDAVIVLGGYDSSNTKKLVEICKENCAKTFHLETIDEFDQKNLTGVSTLGITAGASTPDWIIKEAINKMENIKNTDEESNEQNSMMGEYESTLIRLHDGDIVKGKIIYVTDNEATVDVGYKTDGIIPKNEIYLEGDKSIKDELKPGDEIDVYVLKVNDGEGNVLLSKKRVDAEKNLEYVEQCFNDKTVVEAKGAHPVKGGLTAEVKGVRVFIPASQVDMNYVEDLSAFAGKDLRIVIIEFDMNKRKIIGSRRAVLKEEADALKKSRLETIQAGDIVSGTVSRLTDFGAFIDLGGIDGLIHVSELSWGRVRQASDVLSVGDSVQVYVISVDRDRERISLSLKRTLPKPWDDIASKVKNGDIIEGKVVRIVPFGAFVELEPGVDGLVHISQISDKRINKVEDVLSVGEKVKAKVVEINTENKRISLSIRDAAEEEQKIQSETQTDESAQQNVTVGEIIADKATEGAQQPDK